MLDYLCALVCVCSFSLAQCVCTCLHFYMPLLLFQSCLQTCSGSGLLPDCVHLICVSSAIRLSMYVHTAALNPGPKSCCVVRSKVILKYQPTHGNTICSHLNKNGINMCKLIGRFRNVYIPVGRAEGRRRSNGSCLSV